MSKFLSAVFLVALCFLIPADASAFGELGGACEAECSKCHKATLEEVREIVKNVNPEIEVLSVGHGPVRGLWELAIEARGIKSLAYLDFAKKHIITGSVLDVDTRKNLTNERLYELSKVDLAEIPLGNALVMGEADAKNRVIVFDDPD